MGRKVDFGAMYVQLQKTLEKERGEFALELQRRDEKIASYKEAFEVAWTHIFKDRP